MRFRKPLLKSLILVSFAILFTMSNPVSLHNPTTLFSPGQGISIGLAQGNDEENVILVGEATDEAEPPLEGTEVLEKRTLTSKTYQTGPGQFRAAISATPIHYRDEQGNWQNIDTTIQRQGDGSYYVGANLVTVRFPGQLGAGQRFEIEFPYSQPSGPSSTRIEPIQPADLTTTGSQDVSLAWQPVKLSYSTGGELNNQLVSSANAAQVSATISGNVAVYKGAYPGVSEEFIVVPGGVKHSLILAGLPGFVPDNPPSNSFLDYEVEMALPPGISLYVDGIEQQSDFSTSSTIELRRGEEEIVGYLWAPHAYEKGNPRTQTTGTHLVHYEQSRIFLTVRIPLSWLAAPERVFPVVIDPTTNASLLQDTFMSSTYSSTIFGSWSQMYAGYDSYAGFGRERSLIRWNVEPIPASSNITDATIYLYQKSAVGNASCTLYFYRMANAWSSSYATWNQRYYGLPWNSPGASGTGDYEPMGYGRSYDLTNDTWKGVSHTGIVSWVRGWIDGTFDNYGVMLKPSTPDTYTDCDRGFETMNSSGIGPLLLVDYIFTGGTPTLLLDNSAQTHTYPNPEDYYQEDSAGYTAYWRGTALRPLGQSDFDLWLYTDLNFSDWWVGSRQGIGRVDYTLTRKNVTTTGYPRVLNFYGTDNYNIAYMHRIEQINPPYVGGWKIGSQALWGVFELYLNSPGTWQVIVSPYQCSTDTDPSLADFGVAIHSPTSSDYHTRGTALALSDETGQGLVEQFEFTASTAGYYGLVIWSNVNIGHSQCFQLEVKAPPSFTSANYLPAVMKSYVPQQGAFSNGGFENSSRWILSGELEHERTTAKRRSGSYSLQLGHDGSSSCMGGVPCSGSGEDCESFASATQGIDLPNSGSPTLSFYYQIYTYDHKPTTDRAADQFAVYVRDLSSSVLTMVYLDDLSWVSSYNCDNLSQKSTWQPVTSINLSPYKGKTIELIFEVTNGGHNYWNTWVFVDDVVCSGC